MSKLPMDLSKFRKVKSDADTSTFQHYEGHTITVAHKKLSSKLRSQLEQMPIAKKKVQKFEDGGTVAPETPEKVYEIPGMRSAVSGVTNLLGGHDPTQSTEAMVPPTPPQQAMPESAPQGPATQPTPVSNDPFGVTQAFNQNLSGIKAVGSGEQAEAKALGDQGLSNLEQEKAYQDKSQSSLDTLNQQMAPLLKARQDLMQDIGQGHVDPKRYVDNMTTGGKISSAIGLILGGMGAGLTHGPNLAFQYLQNQIDRDIDSQKTDLGKKENLLTHNLQQTHSLMDAYHLTKMQTNDLLSSHLRMSADQTADPIAKARMLQIAGMTDQKTAEMMQKMGMSKMQQAAFSGQPGMNSGSMLEMLPPEMRERAVQIPGGGMRLGITKEGAKEVRDQFQSIQPIFDSLDQLHSLGPSAMIPGSPSAQKANAIRAQLIPLINENAGLKRLSTEDIGNIKEMFNDPTKFSSIMGSGKTDTFKKFLQDKLMNTMGNQLEGGSRSGNQSQSHGNFGFKPRSK